MYQLGGPENTCTVSVQISIILASMVLEISEFWSVILVCKMVGVQQGQSYLMGRRCLFSLG